MRRLARLHCDAAMRGRTCQVSGGGGEDKFRIKIWDRNNADAVVYDDQLGADDNADPNTSLGGGSSVIHKQ
jgi:hypothetical protein